jgi:hypothetical protein
MKHLESKPINIPPVHNSGHQLTGKELEDFMAEGEPWAGYRAPVTYKTSNNQNFNNSLYPGATIPPKPRNLTKEVTVEFGYGSRAGPSRLTVDDHCFPEPLMNTVRRIQANKEFEHDDKMQLVENEETEEME